MAKKRVNVMLSEEVLRDLREMVPARKRSEFVEEAVGEGLKREKFDRVLERLKRGEGLKAEDYPHWATLEDIHRWLDELRSGGGKKGVHREGSRGEHQVCRREGEEGCQGIFSIAM